MLVKTEELPFEVSKTQSANFDPTFVWFTLYFLSQDKYIRFSLHDWLLRKGGWERGMPNSEKCQSAFDPLDFICGILFKPRFEVSQPPSPPGVIFINMLTCSFYTHRSQRHKKTVTSSEVKKLTVLLCCCTSVELHFMMCTLVWWNWPLA